MPSALDTVNTYYSAWRSGDFSTVRFAPDFRFTGPIDTFDSAEAFAAMATQVAGMVKDIAIRMQFEQGEQVCSIYDFVTRLPLGSIPTAEWISLRDGAIAEINLFYDAGELRRVLNAQ